MPGHALIQMSEIPVLPLESSSSLHRQITRKRSQETLAENKARDLGQTRAGLREWISDGLHEKRMGVSWPLLTEFFVGGKAVDKDEPSYGYENQRSTTTALNGVELDILLDVVERNSHCPKSKWTESTGEKVSSPCAYLPEIWISY